MDEEAENVFPCFQDGDVSIYLSPIKKFQLHSQVLRQNSTFFEEELGHPGAKLTPKARKDGAAAFHFELVVPEEHPTGCLEQREVIQHGKLKNSSLGLGFSAFGLSPTDTLRLKYWEFLLGFFYGRQPDFNEANVVVLLQDCDGFMNVAREVGSAERVREVVDLALLRQDKEIWPGVANNPNAWADLAIKIHSPTIYQEAVIHLIGKWRQVDQQDRDIMDPDLRDTVERVYAELEVAKEAMEMRILGYYPDELHRDAADKPGRPSYSNDIYMWMAVCLFRQFWAQAISDNRTRLGPDGGCEFYRSIWRGGQAYLSHEDFQEFHQYFPMSSKACNILETHMTRLKDGVKGFVKELMVNRSHVPEDSVQWLTCAKIDKSDLPWVKAGVDYAGAVAYEEADEGLDSPAESSDDEDEPMSNVDPKPRALNTNTKGKGKGKRKPTPSTGTIEPFLIRTNDHTKPAAAANDEGTGMLADDEADPAVTES